ncbi:hypothetical protein ABZW30_44185 [Kitasatospora sp. NPDC004669]|uniref:Rv1733c family protein n=1 Tax=Kitasatospora sp. NPDC004669 TaxID=3154555 RepID=UPI0033BF1F33
MTDARRPARSVPARGMLRGHLRRAFGRDGNPLGRPVDRHRSQAVLMAFLGIALAALVCAGATAADYAMSRPQALAAASRLHRVDAVTLSPPRGADPTVAGRTMYAADAYWSWPGDRNHTGSIAVPRRTSPGSTVSTWVDDRGRPVAAPPSATDTAVNALLIGLFAFCGLTVLVASGLTARLAVLDRRACDSWQSSWALYEPVWSGRTAPGKQAG